MQGDLFDSNRLESTRFDCERGIHAPLVDDPPIDHGACVNVPHRCPLCGIIATETSWTKAAWLAHCTTIQRRLRSCPL